MKPRNHHTVFKHTTRIVGNNLKKNGEQIKRIRLNKCTEVGLKVSHHMADILYLFKHVHNVNRHRNKNQNGKNPAKTLLTQKQQTPATTRSNVIIIWKHEKGE